MTVKAILFTTFIAATTLAPFTAVALPSAGAKAPIQAQQIKTENVYCGRYGCHRRYYRGYYRSGYRYYRPYGYGYGYGPRLGIGLGGIGIY